MCNGIAVLCIWDEFRYDDNDCVFLSCKLRVSRNMSIVRLGSAPTSREAFIILVSYVCNGIAILCVWDVFPYDDNHSVFSCKLRVSRNMSIVCLGSAPTSREAFIILVSYVCCVVEVLCIWDVFPYDGNHSVFCSKLRVSSNMSIVRLGSAPASREAFIILESYVCKIVVLCIWDVFPYDGNHSVFSCEFACVT